MGTTDASIQRRIARAAEPPATVDPNDSPIELLPKNDSRSIAPQRNGAGAEQTEPRIAAKDRPRSYVDSSAAGNAGVTRRTDSAEVPMLHPASRNKHPKA